jgi:hypothetical protein
LSGETFFSSGESEILDIFFGQFRVKFGAATNVKNVLKMRGFHNAKLRFFWVKNTISCSSFSLPALHIVSTYNRRKQLLYLEIQLAFCRREL